jgi:hypothetical protein
MKKWPLMIVDEMPTKFEKVYEDNDSVTTMKYDLKKFDRGPIEVEIKYKTSYRHPGLTKKTIKDLMKDEKKTKRNS